jgi:cytochrome c556
MRQLIALPLALLAASSAFAQDIPPDKVIHYRQGVYTMIGWNFGPMGAMVKGAVPFDAAEFAKRAERVAWLAQQVEEGFPPGSDTGATTDAKPAIWEDFADFQAKLADLKRESQALATTAKGSDEAATKAQFMKVAGTCKACHDLYRAD